MAWQVLDPGHSGSTLGRMRVAWVFNTRVTHRSEFGLGPWLRFTHYGFSPKAVVASGVVVK